MLIFKKYISKKKKNFIRIVVQQKKKKCNGIFLDKIASYNKTTNPQKILLNEKKLIKWMYKGAKPTKFF
jgi:small subunit ribosomal protein S16